MSPAFALLLVKLVSIHSIEKFFVGIRIEKELICKSKISITHDFLNRFWYSLMVSPTLSFPSYALAWTESKCSAKSSILWGLYSRLHARIPWRVVEFNIWVWRFIAFPPVSKLDKSPEKKSVLGYARSPGTYYRIVRLSAFLKRLVFYSLSESILGIFKVNEWWLLRSYQVQRWEANAANLHPRPSPTNPFQKISRIKGFWPMLSFKYLWWIGVVTEPTCQMRFPLYR